MTGYKQLISMIQDNHDVSEFEAKKILDKCFFDYDVIVAILKCAREDIEEDFDRNVVCPNCNNIQEIDEDEIEEDENGEYTVCKKCQCSFDI